LTRCIERVNVPALTCDGALDTRREPQADGGCVSKAHLAMLGVITKEFDMLVRRGVFDVAAARLCRTRDLR
jgi:hypothetical protein